MENNEEKISPETPGAFCPVKFRKTDFALLSGIVLLAALLVFLQRVMEPEMGRDSCYYLRLVEQWHHGGFNGVLKVLPDFWFPPLHLYVTTLFTFTGLSPENSAVAFGMICAVLLPLVSCAIAYEMFRDRRIALGAALLTAVNPSVIEMAVQAQRDVPYLLSAGVCLYLLISAIRRKGWLRWIGAGAAFAVALLIRYETAEFLPLLGIYFVTALCKKQEKWYVIVRNLFIFALSGVVFAVILLYVSGTLSYMAGSYCRYFTNQIKAVQKLYNGGQKK